MFAIGKNLLLLGRVYDTEEVIKGIDSVTKKDIDDIKHMICDMSNYSAVCLTDKNPDLKKTCEVIGKNERS